MLWQIKRPLSQSMHAGPQRLVYCSHLFFFFFFFFLFCFFLFLFVFLFVFLRRTVISVFSHIMLPHRNISSQALDVVFQPVTLSWYQIDQSRCRFFPIGYPLPLRMRSETSHGLKHLTLHRLYIPSQKTYNIVIASRRHYDVTTLFVYGSRG